MKNKFKKLRSQKKDWMRLKNKKLNYKKKLIT